MAKGQVIGAPADQQAASGGPRRGGMRPPTGGRPIEVTREVLAAEEAAARGQAAPAAEEAAPQPEPEQTEPVTVVPVQSAEPEPEPDAAPTPAPVVAQAGELPLDLPLDTADPAEILSRCEQIILAARVETEDQLRAVESAWLSKAGPAVRLVHRTKAYKHLTDANGKVYRSFQRWAQERCGISRPHAYRMVNEGPVMEALVTFHTGQLTTRQIDVLAPILRQHGVGAVHDVWRAAEATGGTSAQQLIMKRDVLGLAASPEDYEPPRELTEATPTATLAQVHKTVQSPDRAVLRQAAIESPNAARQTMLAALKLASDLQSVLNELGEDA